MSTYDNDDETAIYCDEGHTVEDREEIDQDIKETLEIIRGRNLSGPHITMFKKWAGKITIFRKVKNKVEDWFY